MRKSNNMITMTVSQSNKKTIGTIALVAALLQPLITIPQIYQIYTNQSAIDVSLLTWLGYLMFGVTFLVYGAVFKLKPIFYGQIVWVIMQIIMVVGIIIYE